MVFFVNVIFLSFISLVPPMIMHHINIYIYILYTCVYILEHSPSCLLQEFNTSGSSNTDTGKASGSLETKYKMKELGLSCTQKWNTDNTLVTEVTVEDQVCTQHSVSVKSIAFLHVPSIDC